MQSQSDPVAENGLEEVNRLEAETDSVPVSEPIPLGLAPGEVLRKVREARGESVVDVAHTLKLSAHQLEALENGRFDILPGPTFVRGFLRNYARYLDIDPEPLLEGISIRTPTAADLASMIKLDGNVQPKASPRPRSGALPVMLAVLVALALAGLVGAGIYKGWFKGWFNFQFDLPTAANVREKFAPPEQKKSVQHGPQPPVQVGPQRPIEPEPQSTVQFKPQVIKLEQPVPVNIAPESARDPLQAGADAIAPALGQVSAAAPESATLRLLFNDSTLAQVRDNSGRLILTRTGTKGSSSSVKGKPPFSVMVKQANNVELEFNGQAVDLKEHTNRDGVARLTLQ
ncbi:MAG: DUF4115 domain-containing protein [Betaproteobacteria bacterium]|nr:DUF4115 domain-containing protein [Betaproteobacteria bacterium]